MKEIIRHFAGQKQMFCTRRIGSLWVLIVWLSCMVLPARAQTTRYGYVGDTFYFAAPNPPFGAINQTAWASRNAAVSVFQDSPYGASATINEYFTGTAEIQCDYYYYDYDYRFSQHGTLRQGHSTTYFYIQCKPVTLTLSDSYLTLDVGNGRTLSYSFSPSNVNPKPRVYWTSSNTNVATVNDNGYVSARSSGSAVITAHNNAGPDATCQVTVRKVDPYDVSLPRTLTTYVGEGENITPTLYPSNAQTTFTWYSSNPAVASVSSSGYVSGKEEGSASIYCVTANGLRSNECSVSVYYRVPTSITCSPSTASVPIGQSKQLSCSVSPSNARYTVEWSSSNESVATVSSSGKVQGLKAGKATIRVTTDNGKTATCQVTVPPNPDKVEVPRKISLYQGNTRTLKATVSPADAYYQLTWSSSDYAVASVSSSGVVTANRPGKATVTVTTQNGKTASCTVEVPETDFRFYVWTKSGEKIGYALGEHPVVTHEGDDFLVKTSKVEVSYATEDLRKFTMVDEGLDPIPSSIQMPSSLELHYGESKKLEYTLLPLDYDIETKLTWTTDNPSAVSVSKEGTVKAVMPGEATVTLTAANGCSAQCVVSVPEPEYNLIVWLRNGERNLFHLSEHPVVSYADEMFTLKTNQTEASYPTSTVRKFTLVDGEPEEEPEVAVRDVRENAKSDLHYGEGTVEMTGGKPHSRVLVYAVDGKLVDTMQTDAEGRLTFSVNQYPAGTYIIKSETITYKIIKR